MVFEIRDNKTVHNRVFKPGAVFDRSDGTLLKIGEYQVITTYFEKVQRVYRQAGQSEIADDILIMHLPPDQEIIDKVFNISGYIKTLYEEITFKER